MCYQAVKYKRVKVYLPTSCYRNVGHEPKKTRQWGGNLGMVIRQNFMRQERLDTLAEFYSQNKKKYP